MLNKKKKKKLQSAKIKWQLELFENNLHRKQKKINQIIGIKKFCLYYHKFRTKHKQILKIKLNTQQMRQKRRYAHLLK